MKINKLHTLGYYITLIKNNVCLYDIDKFEHVWRYLNYLQQEPTPGMFVNENFCPDAQDFENIRQLNIAEKAWEEAEKKVIFKGWKKTEVENYFTCGNYRIMFLEDGMHIDGQFGRLSIICKNLLQLAEYTEGELELKNVEI